MEDENKEALVVRSKVKNYIKEKSDGMKCSDKVIDVLSERVRELCDAAIENAKRDKRKTVQEKDF
ncbi:NFYB/HAP3 family transcription factor subunit [Entomospira nematocerorum]|uniref:Transcription factor CBF/NF-Y/archaeal histone domain-containing protein n=2 Tax=Entomospira TaxID=2834378 RepID=A0A968GGI5_9SPIO|nr:MULTISPECIES: histone-like protein [Entomospira]NIZ40810.1 hypothetical protein [Entomospira entomophilus]NIZ46716.1 hypothetical protein [Entomospira nematocera]WDI33488.1 NFYB/HAP3 family transcription factor subunit [Entomospira nematocera]WDI35022.1 NFYB/HAP3 family transcription factor subunit [Entomospira entomophilus]